MAWANVCTLGNLRNIIDVCLLALKGIYHYWRKMLFVPGGEKANGRNQQIHCAPLESMHREPADCWQLCWESNHSWVSERWCEMEFVHAPQAVSHVRGHPLLLRITYTNECGWFRNQWSTFWAVEANIDSGFSLKATTWEGGWVNH